MRFASPRPRRWAGSGHGTAGGSRRWGWISGNSTAGRASRFTWPMEARRGSTPRPESPAAGGPRRGPPRPGRRVGAGGGVGGRADEAGGVIPAAPLLGGARGVMGDSVLVQRVERIVSADDY